MKWFIVAYNKHTRQYWGICETPLSNETKYVAGWTEVYSSRIELPTRAEAREMKKFVTRPAGMRIGIRTV